MVVDGDLLTRLDIAECHHKNVIGDNLHIAVWLAGMIDVVSAVPSSTSIQTPATIDVANAQPAPSGPAVSFGIGNPLARILCDFFATA